MYHPKTVVNLFITAYVMRVLIKYALFIENKKLILAQSPILMPRVDLKQFPPFPIRPSRGAALLDAGAGRRNKR
jgi:hypothetical protein